MPRKRVRPRADGLFEYKATVGRALDGRAIRKSFYSDTSMSEARAKADEYIKDNHIATALGIAETRRQPVAFDDWARRWLSAYKRGKVRENTYKETYERTVVSYLIPHFRNTPLDSILPIHINEFMNEMKSKYSDSTLKKMVLCLRGIFDAAIDNDLCVKNPARKISCASEIEKVSKRVYTVTESEKLKQFAKSDADGLFILILLELGLRCSELLALKWGDFDLSRRTASIDKAVGTINYRPVVGSTKSKNSRRILPISDELCEAINRNWDSQKSDEFMFLNSAQHLYTVTTFTATRYKQFFKRLAALRPELPQLTPHELRHTCGTLLYERTGDIYAVSKFLGHADVQVTTKFYVHADVETLRRSINR